MISLITIAYGWRPMDDMVDIFLEILKNKSSKINEIIVVHNKEKGNPREVQLGNIKVKHVRTYENKFSVDPSIALHAGLEYTSNPYIIFSDPDLVVCKKNFDIMYLEMMEKYKLNIIGCSHYWYNWQSYQKFPCVINCMIKKEKLPNENWLKNEIKFRPIKLCDNKDNDDYPLLDGKWLAAGPIPSRYKEFPATKLLYDIGCNLFLWDKDNGSRALTFLAGKDERIYNTKDYHVNFNNFNENFKNEILLKHGFRSINNMKAMDWIKNWAIQEVGSKKIINLIQKKAMFI